MATPGLRFICRKSLTPAGARAIDYPLSSRMDEMDCVAVFDDVLVPWERFFIYRNPRLVANILEAGPGQALGQSAIKDLAKAEFLLGLAYNLAESINVLQFPNVQNLIREMITVTEMVRAAVVAAEADPVPGPAGTMAPNPRTSARSVSTSSSPRGCWRSCARSRRRPHDDAYRRGRGPIARHRAVLPGRGLARRPAHRVVRAGPRRSGSAGRNLLYERFFARSRPGRARAAQWAACLLTGRASGRMGGAPTLTLTLSSPRERGKRPPLIGAHSPLSVYFTSQRRSCTRRRRRPKWLDLPVQRALLVRPMSARLSQGSAKPSWSSGPEPTSAFSGP
jgi:hypothetical protein